MPETTTDCLPIVPYLQVTNLQLVPSATAYLIVNTPEARVAAIYQA